MANYNDILMEQLANDGNGAYHYVDTLEQAHSIFVEDLAGTLQVIAKDTKIQVEFNPEVVSRYRLLGYENRRVVDEDFRDNTVEARRGRCWAQRNCPLRTQAARRRGRQTWHCIRPLRRPQRLSYRGARAQSLKKRTGSELPDTSPRFQLSDVVAEYAEILRGSYWALEGNLGDVAAHASRVQRLLNNDPDVVEFADLVYTRTQSEAAVKGTAFRLRLPD